MKMKMYLIIVTLLSFGAATSGKVNQSSRSASFYRPDQLAEYTGKYQKKYDATTLIYIRISLVNDGLVLTSLWDNHTIELKHLSGDNFIAYGPDWSVRFMRDKDKKVTQVQVRGVDLWTKVNP